MGSMSCKEKAATMTAGSEDFLEAVVAESADLAEGQMKEVEVAENVKILLARSKGGTVNAIGAKCSHYGAPLVKGALGDGRVRCPWHGACFNLATGDIEDFPGLDGVPSYEVRELDGKIVVRARRKDLQSNKRTCHMVPKDENNKKTAVIIGGGAAGATCVESLRQAGFSGRIILLCAEDCLPYDRPKLSKALDTDAAKIALRDGKFYQDNGIDVRLGAVAEAVNAAEKTVTLVGGEIVSFDALVVASGSMARGVQNLPGGNLKNIFTLRTVKDANQIASIAKDKRAVIIGNSFIGMEVAAYLKGKAASVVVVGRSSAPFEAVLGADVAGAVLRLFTDAGIEHLGGRQVSAFEPDNNNQEQVSGVRLDDGRLLDADIVIAGIGATPCTAFLKNSSVELDKNDCVIVDQNMQTNVKGIFAAGDVTAAPLSLNGEMLAAPVNIGHWQLSHFHGKVAGRSVAAFLADQPQDLAVLDAVPFFWTMLFGKSIRYAGYGAGFEEVHLTGDLTQLQFVAYYLKAGKAVAVASLNSDPVAAQFAEHLSGKRPTITKEKLLQDHTYWLKL
ncbi:Hypothetical predicted protein [Cloeon dipterum]|uniref:Rieske domain-containing protein n=1 Tax=Cloeon dipterum TaxID=197152 RepID=A0A8S1DMX1_9INSE|nr:Hypothetical predicted protein [Cloeon dipterum]